MVSRLVEVNFDGLVGPTHHFGGLGVGNLASKLHGGNVAKPRTAALQGIEKMRRCVALGSRQAILPPQQRPDLRMLRRLGFEGTSDAMLRAASESAPHVLSAIWSASSMWAANAATVSAGSSCADGKTHLTIANLSSSLHRSLEPAQTLRLFRHVFRDPGFVVHAPLPATTALRDEGAANHLGLCDASGIHGVDLFVYGSDDHSRSNNGRFFPRQSLAASQAIARTHRLDPRSTFFLRQHPDAIDAGAFHNDVVATSHRNVWLYHQHAYLDADKTIAAIEQRFQQVTGQALQRYVIAEANLSLEDAVRSYLFNSQLLSRNAKPSSMTMFCPEQVREIETANKVVESLIADAGPIDASEFVDLRESMHNGGGPACLRLRVPLTESEWQGLPGNMRWSETVANQLCEVIERHYPETLQLNDLTNASLIEQAKHAVDAIQVVLGLGLISQSRKKE